MAPDPAADLALLAAAAEAAGEIALRHFRTDVESWKKSDGGPVSAADLEINNMLAAELPAARPDYGWLSEESTDTALRLDRERVFIVDPIDGTRAFIEGSPGFSVALAVAERGRVTAGVVHLPARGETYAATIGGGATLNGAPIRASARTTLTGADVLAGKPQMTPENWPGGVPEVNRHFRSSLAWRFCLVGSARFDAMFTFRPAWEWDIAAGSLIAAEAGAAVSDPTGGAIAFNAPGARAAGVIAAPEAIHAQLLAHRQPNPPAPAD